MSEVRDYGLDGGAAPTQLTISPMRPTRLDLEAQSPLSPKVHSDPQLKPQSPTESIRLRKTMRSNTVKTYRPERLGREWQPGQEPGIDTKATHPHPSAKTPSLYEDCQITVVDFSEEDIDLRHLDNHSLEPCLKEGRPTWGMFLRGLVVRCRDRNLTQFKVMFWELGDCVTTIFEL